MTGYGKAELNLKNINFTVELRSLNSKQIDINIKIPNIYRDKEIELRKLLANKLKRGKIELSIWREDSDYNAKYILNTKLIKEYFSQIKRLNNELQMNINDIMPSLLKMPEVLLKEENISYENEWPDLKKAIEKAIGNFLQFRLDEGEKLGDDIAKRIDKLTNLLLTMKPLSKYRIERVKKSLNTKLMEIDNNIDKNRFEHELIYYLEKQDITEEQVRLGAHLNYFKKTMKTDSPNGKKLGFIGQEIGREINTIGSKSSDAEMQKIVVEMKNELEKIKEQLFNIL